LLGSGKYLDWKEKKKKQPIFSKHLPISILVPLVTILFAQSIGTERLEEEIKLEN